jgi:DNA-directed RNA polymerase specialized sigma24 family protein
MLPLFSSAHPWKDPLGSTPVPDAELIRRFVSNKDEVAFAELVDRHGPMVLGVARRVVGDYHAAEDVLQATFLALAREASRIRLPQALPAWLHRTARHLGLKAVRGRKRYRRAEAGHAPPIPPSSLDDGQSHPGDEPL